MLEMTYKRIFLVEVVILENVKYDLTEKNVRLEMNLYRL